MIQTAQLKTKLKYWIEGSRGKLKRLERSYIVTKDFLEYNISFIIILSTIDKIWCIYIYPLYTHTLKFYSVVKQKMKLWNLHVNWWRHREAHAKHFLSCVSILTSNIQLCVLNSK